MSEPQPHGDDVASGAIHYGSLCSGIGGLDLAVEAHFGATPAWHSEIEPSPCAVLARHWPDTPNLGDLTALSWETVGFVDIITAGYPCQPFSSAGKRKGASDARHLWPFVAEAVRVLRPQWVVLENVAGHLTLGFGEVLGDLAAAGFDAEWCLLRASDVGACHRRARLFVVARDTDRTREDTRPSAGSPRAAASERHRPAPDADFGRRERRRESESAAEGYGREDGFGRAAGTGPPAADTDGLTAWWDGDAPPRQEGEDARRGHPHGGDGPADGTRTPWGDFAPAVHRWEQVLGREAPVPAVGGQLSPPFVEWMMGYPAGWVDGLSRSQALRALGNAVVPQQGLAALAELCPEATRVGAAA